MAVNPCKECGGPVSDKAESCPQCGAKKPKKTSKLAIIFAGLVLLFIFIGILSGNSDGKGQASQNTASTPTQNEKIPNWEYNTSTDEMRGTSTKYASSVSTNTVNFDFPYSGGSKLILTLRKTGNDTDVMVSITQGQILCDLRGCEVAFKFDDNPVQSISMVEPDNHASDMLFVAYDKTETKIINQLRNSKKLVVEVPFYQEGKKQFTFNVGDLEWSP